MDPLQDLLTMNLTVGNALTVLAVLGMTLFAAKKLVALGVLAASRISLAFITAAGMFVTGAAGVGFSTGELVLTGSSEEVQVQEPEPVNQAIVLTNGDLLKLATSDVADHKLEYILSYAKFRDQTFLEKVSTIDAATLAALTSSPQTQEIQFVEAEPIPAPQELVEEDKEEQLLPTSATTSLLGFSLAMLICSLVTFLYKVSP